jgi:stage V sporulation protein B
LGRTRDIYRAIFSISVPILLTAMTIQVLYLIDQTVLIPLSKGAFGRETAQAWLDVLAMRAQSLAGIPPILAIALSQSLMPVIAAAHASGDGERVRRQASLALRIALFTGLPVVVALTTTAHAVNGLLFENAEGSLIVGWLTASTLFQITMMTSNSILQGLDRVHAATVHTLTGVGLKLALSLALTPWLGVYGLLAATTVCFVFVTVWNLAVIRRVAGVRPLGDRAAGFAAVAVVLAAAGAGVTWAMLEATGGMAGKWPYLLTVAVGGAVTAGLYPFLLARFGVVRQDDLASFPAPLRRLLAPFLRRFGRSARNAAERGE